MEPNSSVFLSPLLRQNGVLLLLRLGTLLFWIKSKNHRNRSIVSSIYILFQYRTWILSSKSYALYSFNPITNDLMFIMLRITSNRNWNEEKSFTENFHWKLSSMFNEFIRAALSLLANFSEKEKHSLIYFLCVPFLFHQSLCVVVPLWRYVFFFLLFLCYVSELKAYWNI